VASGWADHDAAQVADLVEANGQLAAKLAKLDHLLARNSGNSSMPVCHEREGGVRM
jgi:hypothetical protein